MKSNLWFDGVDGVDPDLKSNDFKVNGSNVQGKGTCVGQFRYVLRTGAYGGLRKEGSHFGKHVLSVVLFVLILL